MKSEKEIKNKAIQNAKSLNKINEPRIQDHD